MITLELHSPQPPAVVLNSLQERGGEWRKSEIPPELWRAGVAAVECRVQRSTCTLTFKRRWYVPAARSIRVCARAYVLPDPVGTRVVLDVAYHNVVSPWLVMLLLGVATGIGVALVRVIGLFLFAVGAASLVLQRSMTTVDDRDFYRTRTYEAEYLIGRVESAVASAGEPPGSEMRETEEKAPNQVPFSIL